MGGRFFGLDQVFFIGFRSLFLLFSSFSQVLSDILSCTLHFFDLRLVILFEAHGLGDHHVEFLGAHHLAHLNVEIVAAFEEGVGLNLVAHVFLLHQESRVLQVPLLLLVELFLRQPDLEPLLRFY